jgi:hypothetical protein
LTEKIAVEAAEEPHVRLLMGFTGIDYYSAMLLLAEMGDIRPFSSPKKLVAYAGLAPGMRSSAGKTTRGHITKEGNKYLRWILIEAAQHASRFDPKLRGNSKNVIPGFAESSDDMAWDVLVGNEPSHAQCATLMILLSVSSLRTLAIRSFGTVGYSSWILSTLYPIAESSSMY